MKKILTILATLLILTGCNYQVLDTHYAYDYAIIERYDGEQRVEIKSWRDYEDGDQIQITTVDGTTYLLHSSKVILVKE